MKYLALFLLFLLSSCVTINPNQGYLIVDATVTDTHQQQPTWIALSNYSWTTHLSTQQPIQTISPGRYKISHIDFQKSRHAGDGTAFSYEYRSQRFAVEAGVIYFLGMVELDYKNKGAYSIEIKANDQLISRACDSRPDLFTNHPVRFVHGKHPEKNYSIDCDKPATLMP